jgi:hypothetical protein
VVVHRLLGVALEDFGRVWPIAIGLGGGLAEVDDVLDVHFVVIPRDCGAMTGKAKVYVY